jgi:hypothetical protein
MRLVLLAMAAAVGLFPSPAWSQAPALSMEWLEFRQSHHQCMERAERAIQISGHRITSRLEYSVFARPPSMDYTLVVRCVSDKSMVILVCAGPSLRVCDDYLDRIKAAY